jgi:hypothetical protein
VPAFPGIVNPGNFYRGVCMLKPERLLIALAVTVASLFGEDSVQVKELTATQKKALSVASEKLRRAQSEYETVVDGVKAAYGAYPNAANITAGCSHQQTEAELISDNG